MTTLFDNTGLPLWVYIVLIVVGSTLLLVVVALLVRWWCVRRRRVSHRGLDTLTGATRRVTLRRGRVVPTSQHLSLTGSRFGVGQFGLLGDNESAMTGRRSPFEWWNNMMAERSHSRLDQMSQIETGSLMSRSASRGTLRREFRSTTPNQQTPEKNKETTTSTWEVTPPSPLPSPSPSMRRTTVNFSRAFLSQTQTPSSPLTQRSQHTLSRISERSPHQSMISMNPGDSLTTRYSSHQAALNPLDSTPRQGHAQSSPTTPRRPPHLALPSSKAPSASRSPTFSAYRSSPLSTPPLAPEADAFRTSATFTRPHTSTHSAIPPRPLTADTATSRRSDLLATRQHSVPTPAIPVPRPVVYPAFNSISGSRQPQPSLYRHPSKSQPNLPTTHTRSVVYTAQSDSGTPSPQTPKSPSGIVYDSQVSIPWPTRLDVQDLSSTLHDYDDHKGASNHADRIERESIMGIVTVPGKRDTRVLRKKSLKRLPKATSMTM